MLAGPTQDFGTGHWAQDEADWVEAELCFRKAYDLAGGHYGYCLGTALNFLGRFEESLPILREQAERIQPDAMSWFQLGAAYGDLGQSAQAIDAYEKALALDPDYDLAMSLAIPGRDLSHATTFVRSMDDGTPSRPD